MPLLQLLEVLIVVGVVLWLINRFIPMQGTIKSILNAVVVIAVVLWLMNIFGLFHSLSRMRVGRCCSRNRNNRNSYRQHGRSLPQGETLKTQFLLTLGLTLSLSAFAQDNSQTTGNLEPMSTTPTFRVTVISRSVQAVNYKHRSGASKVDFAGPT